MVTVVMWSKMCTINKNKLRIQSKEEKLYTIRVIFFANWYGAFKNLLDGFSRLNFNIF